MTEAATSSPLYFVSRQAECMIVPLWKSGKDTLEIARALALPEYEIANRLPILLEQHRTERLEMAKDFSQTPRTPGDKLTADEVESIRAAFEDGRDPADIAGDLHCSTRNVSKYYARFRGCPAQRGRPAKKPEPEVKRPVPPRASRFYSSTFEL